MTIPFEDPEPLALLWDSLAAPAPAKGVWLREADWVMRDLLAATQRLYLSDQPQQLARATDFGNVVITVAWPVDPRQERDDDPPLC